MKKIMLLLALLLNACGKPPATITTNTSAVEIPSTIYELSDSSNIQKIHELVPKIVNGDSKSLSKLININCFGGSACYDLGEIITQTLYLVGEDEFVKMVEPLSKDDKASLRSWLMAGIEYGNNDIYHANTNRPYEYFQAEFPKLFSLLFTDFE